MIQPQPLAAKLQDASTAEPVPLKFKLHLFVVGEEPNSKQAREQVDRLVATYPDLNFEVEVTDILDAPETAEEHRAFVAPMLIVLEPAPCRVYGNLSDWGRLQAAVGLREPAPSQP